MSYAQGPQTTTRERRGEALASSGMMGSVRTPTAVMSMSALGAMGTTRRWPAKLVAERPTRRGCWGSQALERPTGRGSLGQPGP